MWLIVPHLKKYQWAPVSVTYLKMAMRRLSSRILATNRYSAIITVTSVPPNSSKRGVLNAVLFWPSTKTKTKTKRKYNEKQHTTTALITSSWWNLLKDDGASMKTSFPEKYTNLYTNRYETNLFKACQPALNTHVEDGTNCFLVQDYSHLDDRQ